MLPAHGLYGHIRNNAVKSALLLSGFVGLIAIYWWAGCLALSGIALSWTGELNAQPGWDGYLAVAARAWELAKDRWYVPVAVSLAWFICAAFVYHWAIRSATGARPVARRAEPRLYNMVETLAIAAGLPMPRVEVIETAELNAYAAGLTANGATIAVTRGLLQSLDDDEVAAVLAHEMTHIKNHDVRLMVVALIFAGGITLLGDLAAALWRSDDDDDVSYEFEQLFFLAALVGVQVALLICFYFALAVVAIQAAATAMAVTHLFAILTQLAISRSREYIADAGSVELTKDPDALISALMRISGHDDVPVASEAFRGLMISRDCPDEQGFFDELFETHPPLSARVERLETYAGGHIVARVRKADQGRTFSHPISL